jgi:ribosome biogenesis ATPase
MPPRVLQGLDRDVYEIIRKLEDQHLDDKKPPKFTVSGVYDTIKHSNSSLARQKKRPLEDSILRVLRLRQEEKQEHDPDADLEEQSAASPNPQVWRHHYYVLPANRSESDGSTDGLHKTGP